MNSEIVMNINDLRKVIFSFLRKTPKIQCITCNDVCIWDKKIIKKYIEYPIYDATVIISQCHECYYGA
jgi:hypothetical protein